jgi:hypothetical protein
VIKQWKRVPCPGGCHCAAQHQSVRLLVACRCCRELKWGERLAVVKHGLVYNGVLYSVMCVMFVSLCWLLSLASFVLHHLLRAQLCGSSAFNACSGLQIPFLQQLPQHRYVLMLCFAFAGCWVSALTPCMQGVTGGSSVLFVAWKIVFYIFAAWLVISTVFARCTRTHCCVQHAVRAYARSVLSLPLHMGLHQWLFMLHGYA